MAFTSNDKHELWRLLLIGQRRMSQAYAARLKADFDLTTAQFEALVVIQEASDHTLSMSHLSKRVLYSSGSATNLIKRLEERGLVTRSTGTTDARSVLVSLSDAGADLITRARAAHEADLEDTFVPLVEEEEMETLMRFARRLSAHRTKRTTE